MTGLLGPWLAASLLASSPVATGDVTREIAEIFEQDRYYFCADDNEYLPQRGDQRWCELAAASRYRGCPGYELVCARPGPDGSMRIEGGSGSESSESDADGPTETNPHARRDRERSELQLPDLGAFAKVLMWALLIGLAIGVVIAIARNLVRDRADDDDEPELEPDASESLIAARAEAMRAVETDVQRLLARAEAAAARGEHEAAITDVHAAVLRRLEGEQLISVDRWKTNGDFLQALRARPQLRDELRAIVREVEQIQFGAAEADASRYRSIRAKVLAIVGRASLVVALALGLGAQTACDPSELEQPDAAALAGLGTGPGDQRAIGELLLRFDIDARHRSQSIDQLAQTHGAIVLLEGVELRDEDWDRLIAWVEDDGGMLVIATGREFPREIGVDYGAGTLLETGLDVTFPGDDLDELELAAPPGRTVSLRGAARNGEELLVRPEPSEPWAQNQDRAYAVRHELGKNGGEVVVFAESDLLTNAGLLVEDNGALLVNFLRSADIDAVEFVNGYTGAGADNPMQSVREAKLGALFLQILLFLAVLYAAVGLPFARLRDPPGRRRRAFAEHVHTLGQRYAQARAARWVAGLYCGWALDRLRERLQPGSVRGLLVLAQAIAARTGGDEGRIMQILVEAHELRDAQLHATQSSHGGSSRGGPAELEIMRAIARLLEQTGGTRH